MIQEARRRQHRRWLVIAVAIAVAAGGAATVIAGSGAGSRPRPPGPHGLPAAAGHGRSGAVAHAAALVTVSQTSLAKSSLSLAAGYRAVWVTGIGVTYEINEVTGQIARTIRTPGTGGIFCPGCPSGIAAGAGGVWVTHGCRGIYRIDPHTGRVTGSLRIPTSGSIAVADGVLWVDGDRGLVRIQPRTNRIIGDPIRVPDGVLTPGAGALWLTSNADGLPSTSAVYRVDAETGTVQRLADQTVTDVQAVGAGSLWSSQVQRVDPATGRVGASIFLGASQVAFWHGSAWALTLPRSLTFLRIDPATNQVTGKPVPVGKPLPGALAWNTAPTAIAAGPTGLWVLDWSRSLLYHLALRPARP